MPSLETQDLLIVGLSAAGVFLGMALTMIFSRLLGKNLMGRARLDAAQTISDAEREAATILKEATTTLKEQEIDLRQQVERESQRQRKELFTLEKRILTKEESLDKRVDALENKASNLSDKEGDLEGREEKLRREKEQVAKLIAEQMDMLERVSGMTADEARRIIFERLDAEVRRDTALRLKRIEDEMVEASEKKGQRILSEAIQRCAADHIAEHSISVVALASDEMKGRIIGREGRNIRALENATGINLIIDDTPEAVVLSGFDPVRREIAKIALERLITDGRIHPARIEEVVQKASEDMEKTIKEYGEEACLEVDIHGLHSHLVALMGRLKFRTSYGQNVLRHSQEVAFLSGILAAEIGDDVQLAKRAGFLHDIGKAMTHEVEGSHAVIGHDALKRYGENDVVANSAGSHHNEMPQESVISVLVQAADALSAARPGARRETIDTYVKRIQQLEQIANEFPGVEKTFAIQAGREIRIIVKPDRVDDARAQQIARDVARKVEAEVTYPGQIRVTVVRETRAVEVAQ